MTPEWIGMHHSACVRHPGRRWCRQMNLWRLFELTRSPKFRWRQLKYKMGRL